jgi:RNA polymerase sigma factor (sigma-70 family)
MHDSGGGRPDLNSPSVWTGLIESVGPGSLLLIIEYRLSAALRRQVTPEDILQDALLHAWRDRAQCQWRGLRSFRSWLLTLIDHCIRDAADYENAQKRGGGSPAVPFSVLRASDGTDSAATFDAAVASTTPSRLAIYREQAAAMRDALTAVPELYREVVRLRLLEQLRMHEIAGRLGLGIEAVRHRFRVGSEAYKSRLLTSLSTCARSRFSPPTPDPPGESASMG